MERTDNVIKAPAPCHFQDFVSSFRNDNSNVLGNPQIAMKRTRDGQIVASHLHLSVNTNGPLPGAVRTETAARRSTVSNSSGASSPDFFPQRVKFDDLRKSGQLSTTSGTSTTGRASPSAISDNGDAVSSSSVCPDENQRSAMNRLISTAVPQSNAVIFQGGYPSHIANASSFPYNMHRNDSCSSITNGVRMMQSAPSVEAPSPAPGPTSTSSAISNTPHTAATNATAASGMFMPMINQNHHPSSASLQSVISSVNMAQFAQHPRPDSQVTPPSSNVPQQNGLAAGTSGKVTPSPTEFHSQNSNNVGLMNHVYGATQIQNRNQLAARNVPGANTPLISGVTDQNHTNPMLQPNFNFQVSNVPPVIPNYYLAQPPGYPHPIQTQLQQLQSQNQMVVGNAQGNVHMQPSLNVGTSSNVQDISQQQLHGHSFSQQQQQLLLQQQQQQHQRQLQQQQQQQQQQGSNENRNVTQAIASTNVQQGQIAANDTSSNSVRSSPQNATAGTSISNSVQNAPMVFPNGHIGNNPALVLGTAAGNQYPGYFYANTVAAQGQHQMGATPSPFIGHMGAAIQNGTVQPHLVAFGGANIGAFPPQNVPQSGCEGLSTVQENERNTTNNSLSIQNNTVQATSRVPNKTSPTVSTGQTVSNNAQSVQNFYSAPNSCDVNPTATAVSTRTDTSNVPPIPESTMLPSSASNTPDITTPQIRQPPMQSFYSVPNSSDPTTTTVAPRADMPNVPIPESSMLPSTTSNTPETASPQLRSPFMSSFESVLSGHNGLVLESTASKLTKKMKTSQIPEDEEIKKMTAREKNRIHSRNSRARKRDAILRIKEEHAHLQIYRIMMDAMTDMVSLHEMSDDAKYVFLFILIFFFGI